MTFKLQHTLQNQQHLNVYTFIYLWTVLLVVSIALSLHLLFFSNTL